MSWLLSIWEYFNTVHTWIWDECAPEICHWLSISNCYSIKTHLTLMLVRLLLRVSKSQLLKKVLPWPSLTCMIRYHQLMWHQGSNHGFSSKCSIKVPCWGDFVWRNLVLLSSLVFDDGLVTAPEGFCFQSGHPYIQYIIHIKCAIQNIVLKKTASI